MLARPALRRQAVRAIGRRYESTTSKAADSVKSAASSTAETTKQAASSAKETASAATSKAGEGLSKVTSAAGGAARGLGNAVSSMGGRAGRLVAVVERQVPQVVYYSRVGLELGKMVANGQKMNPPSVATFQSYFNRLSSALRNPSSLAQSAASSASAETAQSAISQVRGLSRGQMIAGGVIVAEVLGFFTVGEMLGRMKIIGYHGEPEGAEHH